MKDATRAFVIFGRIFDPDDNQGIAGLTIEALDKDLLLDDRLGSATTNAEGQFQIQYDRSDFQDLFFETKPDIYLQVKNTQGEIVYTTIDKVRHQSASVEEFSIALPKQEAYSASFEHTRRYFKQLIKINPNYFGTAPKQTAAGELASNPVFALSQNTKYEELRCVGLYPEEDLLEAMIDVKLPYGFSGSLCSNGSKEYVAFFIDYDDGMGWVSAGAPTQVSVHDLVAVNKSYVSYAVRRSFIPKQILKCSQPQVLKVRAVLSWEAIPTGPNFIPVWGNTKDVWVQIRPKKFPIVIFPPIINSPQQLDMVKPFPEQKLVSLPIPLPKPQFTVSGDFETIRETVERTFSALEEEKQSGQVESPRLEFNSLIEENPNYFGSISEATDAATFSADVAKLPPQTIQYLAAKYTLDPSILQAVFPQNPKTKYEELTCVGLYPEEDLLEATLTLKLPYGYNGDLCTFGSWEYVAFYIDWGTGWEYVDTVQVRVHNIPVLKDRVLHYAVKVRIANIQDRLKVCQTENVIKVRALLSWNYDPTPFGPYYSPPWGNALERYIQIRPKTGASVVCSFERVSDVHIDEIAQSGPEQGYAYDPEDTVPPLDYNRPFGGVIAAWGNVNIPDAVYYRFRFSADNGTTWSNVPDKRIARDPSSWTRVIERLPLDSEGWFSIADYRDVDQVNYSNTPLIHWRSYGKNGSYLLRLELADVTKNPMPGQVAEVAIQLDNTAIDFYSFRNTPINLPESGVAVKDSAGKFKKCDSFNGADPIKVYGNFRDDHFRYFTVRVAGGNISGEYEVRRVDFHDVPILGIDKQGIVGAADNGDGQEIASFNLCDPHIVQSPVKVKCAYSIILRVYDRAIVGYTYGYEFYKTQHGRTGYVTFDWDPAGQC